MKKLPAISQFMKPLSSKLQLMKTLSITFSIILGFMVPLQLYAQAVLSLQPGSSTGKDAVVWSGQPTSNFGAQQSLNVYAWFNSNLASNTFKRAYLEFDLGQLPSSAVIIDAELNLFHNPTDPYEGRSTHFGANDFYIKRVTSSWSENTITWNNQPGSTTSGQVSVAASTSGTQDFSINVTNMVNFMHANPSQNHGFLVQLQNEAISRMLILGSSDHSNSSYRPELVITYDTIRCVLIQPGSSDGKDASVWENAPTSNYGNLESINVYAWTNGGVERLKRAFVDFDLSVIPSGAFITSRP